MEEHFEALDSDGEQSDEGGNDDSDGDDSQLGDSEDGEEPETLKKNLPHPNIPRKPHIASSKGTIINMISVMTSSSRIKRSDALPVFKHSRTTRTPYI